MAKRKGSILDDLALLPWWVNVGLAVIVYLSLKYWIPTIKFEHPFYAGIAKGAHALAAALAGIMLVTAAVSAFNSRRKDQLLERQKGIGSIRSISWREFEELVGEAYRRQGYRVTETGGGGADGGVVICSGAFTREARDFARAKPMELIDGTALAWMVKEAKEKPSPVNLNPIISGARPSDNACPLCGGGMALRTARKGANAGGKFRGCSDYPKCRGTRQFSA